MRSLRTAGVIVVLAGCNYENPGFKVKGSGTGSGASETAESGSGATTETSVSSTPPTTSTSEPIEPTTDGPGSSVTDTSGDPNTSTSSDSSTGELLPWDNSCPKEDIVEGARQLAVADNYFFNSYKQQPPRCDFTDQPLSEDFNCVDLNAGQDDFAPMVFDDIGDMNPANHLRVLVGVRFSLEGLEDGGEPVPRSAVVDSTLELYFFRANAQAPWDPPEFDLYALEAEGQKVVHWAEGEHFGAGGCSKGEPSFRCLACGESPTGLCEQEWGVPGSVYKPGESKFLQHFSLGEPAPKDALMHPVGLELPATDHALDTGLLVVATTKMIWKDGLELKSRNYDSGKVGPFLTVRYCPNPN